MALEIETRDGEHIVKTPEGRIFGKIVAHTTGPYAPGWRFHHADGWVGFEGWYSYDAATIEAWAHYTDACIKDRAMKEAEPFGTALDIWPYNEDPENPEY